MLERLKKLLFGDKLTLEEVEKERGNVLAQRERLNTELDMLQAKMDRVFRGMVEARRSRNDARLNVDYERYKLMQDESNRLQREFMLESRKYALLARTAQALKREKERTGGEGFARVMEKIKKAGIVEKLTRLDVEDEQFSAEVEALLDVTEESLADAVAPSADPGRTKLFDALDAVIKAENAGEFEEALDREAEAKKHIRRERNPLADD